MIVLALESYYYAFASFLLFALRPSKFSQSTVSTLSQNAWHQLGMYIRNSKHKANARRVTVG